MALDFAAFETALQEQLDAAADPKTMLLLGKAVESTIGSLTVSDVQDAGAAQIAAVQAEGESQIEDIETAAAALAAPELTLVAARSLGAL